MMYDDDLEYEHDRKASVTFEPDEPLYVYADPVIRPALNVILALRPQSIAFDVIMARNIIALKHSSSDQYPGLFADPLQPETDWLTATPVDTVAINAIRKIDRKLIPQSDMGEAVRELCLRLHNETAYVVVCSGNATTESQPVRVTARLTPRCPPSRGVN